MISKVPLLSDIINKYCSSLILPYPIRDLAMEREEEEQANVSKPNGKKKTTGGPSGPSKEKTIKKRNKMENPPTRTNPKHGRKSPKKTVMDKPSDSDKTISDPEVEVE
ncbi:hypothetical protein L2E82_09918 [Cichorium intybus]|uniref:Uncharacterized protein n=1 Tax=Cichorium intybus TaxID=13427 RepID=A0ACB9G8Y3_CICIN|nr:hypothetical protein L2E82_09918 [Cichorium intybus]